MRSANPRGRPGSPMTVAVVAISVRLPGGVADLDGLDRALLDRKLATGKAPRGRSLRGISKSAGWLSDVAAFDAAAFGVSAAEAAAIDPQQRCLLEETHHAIERWGRCPRDLAGRPIGVWTATGLPDYAQRTLRGAPNALSAWSGTGSFPSVAAGRIAHTWGLRGPAIAIDTACSSGLVAVHQAVAALRTLTVESAIIGGANLLLSAAPTLAFERLGALSRSDRCRPFDNAADGYVRAEGVVVVILRRLADALADGDPVLAVIHGSAINHDGRTHALTAPSGSAQQDVVRAALQDAQCNLADVGCVETHGTGTPLGDPIEAIALGSVFAGEGPPVWLSAVKGLLGHTEPVSGLVGLATAVIRAKTRRVDAIPGLVDPNARISPHPRVLLPVATQVMVGSRIVVNAFGLAGTNASVIVGPAPVAPPERVRTGPTLALWSGPRKEALAIVAAEAAATRASWPESVAAAAPRAGLKWRAFTVAADRPDSGSLEAAAASAMEAPQTPAPTVWVFTGQGVTTPGMARSLVSHEPAFAANLDALEPAFRDATGLGIRETFEREDVGHTRLGQPALVALQIALARTLQGWGLQPDSVLGHSVGEISALVVAGVIEPWAALAFAAARGRAMGDLPPGGSMIAVSCSPDRLPPLGDVEIAAINGAQDLVLSGPDRAVASMRDQLLASGIDAQSLLVSHAFHSALVDDALAQIDAAATGLRAQTPRVPVYATLTGALAGPWITHSGWWREQARRPVRFAQAVAAARADGHATFVEIGPHPALRLPSLRTAPDLTWIPTLVRGEEDVSALLHTVGHLWQLGHRPDVRAVVGHAPSGVWPVTPFLKDSHWIPSEEESTPETRRLVWTKTHAEAPPGTWSVRGSGTDADRWRDAVGDVPNADRALFVLPDGTVDEVCTAAVSALSDTPTWFVGRPFTGNATHTAAWAAIRCLAIERPGSVGGCVQVDADTTAAQWRAALGVATDGAIVRADGVYTPRLIPFSPGVASVPTAAIVTGGTGALGRAVVASLLARGCSQVVVVSRTGSAIVGTVGIVGDAADRSVAQAAMTAAGPDCVVFHLAGVAATGFTAESLAQVMHAKMGGIVAFRSAGARQFVISSSVSATWGAKGLGAYAAANGMMDAQADDDVTVVSLGPIIGGMMGDAEREEASRLGLWALTPEEAAEALIDARGGPTFRLVFAADWNLMARAASVRGPRPLFEPDQRFERVTVRSEFNPATVLDIVNSVLGRPCEHDRGWFEQGLDSVGAVELSQRLSRALDRTLPATLTFDHGTPTRLLAYLSGETPGVDVPRNPTNVGVVVCGLAVRLPGAENLSALWTLLQNGTPVVTPVPADREWPPPDAGKPVGHRTGLFLADLFSFDAMAYGLSPREAAAMDPQHRLLLDLSVEALSDAGLGPRDLEGTRTGVWVGIGRSEYWERLSDRAAPSWASSGTGNESAFAAGRLAWWLGTRGPALSINTACSSSLVAIHTAIRAIASGEVDRAVVGGVNALLDPDDQAWVAEIGALSPTGRCRPFSADADGYVRAEGGGVLLLAREDVARAAGHPILARLVGSAVNHDGRGPGLTVPSGEAQRAVLRHALASAGATAKDVVAIEAHGTGTPLGDPIEAGALAEVYGDVALPVASIKALVGHLEAAAGMASIARAVLSLQHGVFTPSGRFGAPNPNLRAWAARFPNVAEPLGVGLYAVSGFGMSGTNAHLLLARGDADRPPPRPLTPRRPTHLRIPRAPVALPCWREVDGAFVPASEGSLTGTAIDIAHALAKASRAVSVDADDPLVAGLVATARAERPDLDVTVTGRLRRLVRLEPQPKVAPTGCWVVTGAGGGLGPQIVAWLLQSGAERVIAVGRRRPSFEDARVVTVAADAADVTAISAATTEPIRGVLHLAAVVSDGLLGDLTVERLAAARFPKAFAARALATAFPTARHIWFGSAVTHRGRLGVGAYAAANAELESLARECRSQGIAATTIAWGPWEGVGLAADRVGWTQARPHSVAAGLSALGDLLGTAEAVVVAIDGAPQDAQLPSNRGPVSLGQAQQLVDTALRTVLGRDDIPPDRGFFELGMDSVTAVHLARLLSEATGMPLPATVAFSHPRADSLARHLAGLTFSPPPVATTSGTAVAIVGAAIRFPGANSLEELWTLLTNGEIRTGDVPHDRWDSSSAPGSARHGAFLDDVRGFDPEAFRMAPHEAAAVDPQQRLLLLLTREAAERAGRLPTLSSDRTGVFIGVADRGYLRRFRDSNDLYPDPWSGTGNEPAFAAGRIAHVFGLRGPAVSLDTTCSSALVAIHLAVRALRTGECEQAVVGAASLLLMPDDQAYLASIGALSPSGQCHAFREAADGYVRGEGAAVFILRRLDDARASNDRILGVIRGSAMGHDGASAGLTVPSGPAQEAVLRDALADAKWTPSDLSAVEAHGTGTTLGDPIEIEALEAVFRERAARLPVGTVKANLGHLELAAGAAGMAKALLVAQHRLLPPQPGGGPLNPHVRFRTLQLAETSTQLDGSRVSVSAFGLSGTNAVVLIEAEPQVPDPATPDSGQTLLAWTAPTEASAIALGDALPRERGNDVAASLVDQRMGEAFRAWRILSPRDPSPTPIRTRRRPARPPRIAFLCTGQGAQHGGMLLGLEPHFPVVHEAIEACATVLAGLGHRPIRETLADDAALSRTEAAQPALFVVGWCLYKLWTSLGVTPDAVAGHSAGELLAATIAGVFSLDDALRLVTTRGARMGALPDGSGMTVLHTQETTAQALLSQGVVIADVNHPEEIVVAGATASLESVEAAALSRGIRTTRLRVSHAFHSPWMSPMLDAWEADVAGVARNTPTLPFGCNLTGRRNGSDWTDARRWRDHASQPVRFADAVRDLASTGIDLFIELGPHPILLAMAQRSVELPETRHFVATQRRGEEPVHTFLTAVGRCWEAGGSVDFSALHGPAARLTLPPTPLQLRPTWLAGDRVTSQASQWRVAWQPASASDFVPLNRQHIDHPPSLTSTVEALWQTIETVRRGPPQWWALRNAVGDQPDPAQAAIWALLRSVRAEAPDLVLGQVDVGDGDVAGGPPEAESRWQNGWFVPRLRPDRPVPRQIDASATWLLSGGSGAIALALGDALIEAGVLRLVLLSRRLPMDDRVARWQTKGAHVHAEICDVCDADAVVRVVSDLPGRLAVIHAAGTTEPLAFRSIDKGTLARICAAKVDGSLAWVAALRNRDVRSYIVTSSIAAVWGGKDLSGYAAANGFAEAIALSLGGSAVAMGPWGGGGMTNVSRAKELQRRGLRLLAPSRAATALLTAPPGRSILADVDWSVARPLLEVTKPLPLLAALAVHPTPAAPIVGATSRAAEPVEATILRRAREALRLSPETPLALDRPLHDFGFDSLIATELKNSLLTDGIDVPMGRLLGGPSVQELADMVRPQQSRSATATSNENDVPHALWWTHVAAILVGLGAGVLIGSC